VNGLNDHRDEINIGVAPILDEPGRISGLTREQLGTLLEQLKALEGAIMARLLCSQVDRPLREYSRATLADDRTLNANEIACALGVDRRWVFRHLKILPFVRRISRKSLAASERDVLRWRDAQKP
jgi:hypothetical protein